MKEDIFFDLTVLSGNWESINLNPTVIIYRDGDRYLLSVIHICETSQQAKPATYEIQTDEDGYYISYNLKTVRIYYDMKQDVLTLSTMGDYLRS
jgi:hypothetical protein